MLIGDRHLSLPLEIVVTAPGALVIVMWFRITILRSVTIHR
jgi:hypothetical protein